MARIRARSRPASYDWSKSTPEVLATIHVIAFRVVECKRVRQSRVYIERGTSSRDSSNTSTRGRTVLSQAAHKGETKPACSSWRGARRDHPRGMEALNRRSLSGGARKGQASDGRGSSGTRRGACERAAENIRSHQWRFRSSAPCSRECAWTIQRMLSRSVPTPIRENNPRSAETISPGPHRGKTASSNNGGRREELTQIPPTPQRQRRLSPHSRAASDAKTPKQIKVHVRDGTHVSQKQKPKARNPPDLVTLASLSVARLIGGVLALALVSGLEMSWCHRRSGRWGRIGGRR